MLPGWRFYSFQFLDIVRQDNAGDGTFGQGDPDCPVDQMSDLGRIGCHLYKMVGHILEQGDQVHLLLVIGSQGSGGLLPDDGHHRLMVHLGIVEAIEKMNGSRSGGGDADPDFTGEFGVTAGHECSFFLMPCLIKADLFLCPIQCSHYSIYAVPRITVDPAHAPVHETLHQIIAGSYCHLVFLHIN